MDAHAERSIAETFVALAGALAKGRDVLDTMDDLIEASTSHNSAVATVASNVPLTRVRPGR